MNAKLRSLWRGWSDLHQDEEGMEAIQVVAIVAIAAIVLIFLKTFLWGTISRWAKGQVDDLTQ